MYHDFFGLDAAPFKITPNLDLFYPGGRRGAVLDALLYAVTSGEGIIKVVGEVGSGKTMLCRMLEDRLPAHAETIYLANPSLSRDEILHAIGDELGLDLHHLRSAQMLRAVQEHLISKYSQGKQVVLFIDEAQAVPLDTLEEIRLLSNLETGDRKLLQMVLFGQPELDQHLSDPRIRQLRERITHSFNLAPFDGEQIRDYLSFRLRAVGYSGPDLFSPRVAGLISRASGGLVRRVNILADKAMLAAFAENSHQVEAGHVKAAIGDSGFKPFVFKRRFVFAAALLLAALAGFGVAMGLRYFSPPAPVPVPREAAAVAPTPSPAPTPAPTPEAPEGGAAALLPAGQPTPSQSP